MDGGRPPGIRTFKPRRRALSPARAELLDRLSAHLVLDERGPVLDAATVFGRVAPLVVEIGFGAGEAMVAMAAADPGTDVIGCEVHTPGVAAALAAIDAAGLTNVRVVHGDALTFLDRLPAAPLAGIRAFFPDPWPKERHRRRRLVAPDQLERLVTRLVPGGTLHIATDIAAYAAAAERACGSRSDLVGGRVPRPDWRPVTRFETKGHGAGRPSIDLIYRRL